MNQKTVPLPAIIASVIAVLAVLSVVFYKMNGPQAGGAVSSAALEEKQSMEAQDKLELTTPRLDYSKRNDH